nr:hypothetical protein [Tanacetum cinerariifolium]
MQTTEKKIDMSKALDASLVDTESSETESKEQDTSSRSGNDAHDDDADIRPIYDEELMAKEQTTAEFNVFAIGQQHTEQPEFNNEGEVDQNVKECHKTYPLPAILIDNQIPEHSYQSLKSGNISLKNELRKLKGNSMNTKFAKQSILGKPMLQSYRNQSVVRQPNAFKFERPRILKPRCDSQVDENYDLSKPVTTHYLSKEREAASAKPHHIISSSNSRVSSKKMLRFSSIDMVHNHYLEEAKKKTQERSKSLEPSLMPYARSQSTANGRKPKPKSDTQTSRNWPAFKSSFATTKTVPIEEHPRNSSNFFDLKHFVCSTCQKCVFNANHYFYVIKFLKEVKSRAKVPSNKTTKRNKPVEQISVAKKPERQIPKGHRFSIKKNFIVHEKTMTPRSCLR